jgi:hypothetical protein
MDLSVLVLIFSKNQRNTHFSFLYDYFLNNRLLSSINDNFLENKAYEKTYMDAT